MAERKPKQQKPAAKERAPKGGAKKRAKDLDVPEDKGGKVKGGGYRIR